MKTVEMNTVDLLIGVDGPCQCSESTWSFLGIRVLVERTECIP